MSPTLTDRQKIILSKMEAGKEYNVRELGTSRVLMSKLMELNLVNRIINGTHLRRQKGFFDQRELYSLR